MFLLDDKNIFQDAPQAVFPQGFSLGDPLLAARIGRADLACAAFLFRFYTILTLKPS
jgi:hypothetical protein